MVKITKPKKVVCLLLVVFIASGAALFVTVPTNDAAAMGTDPVYCNNLYGTTLKSIVIYYDGGTLNPLATPNATLTLSESLPFNVTVTLETNPTSTNGNTLPGSYWTDFDNGEVPIGLCNNFASETSPGNGANDSLGMVGPNEMVRQSFLVPNPGLLPGGLLRICDLGTASAYNSLKQGTISGGSARWNVNWTAGATGPVATTNSTTTITTTVSTTTTVTVTSQASPSTIVNQIVQILLQIEEEIAHL